MWVDTMSRLLSFSAAGGVLCGVVWDILLFARILLGVSEAPQKINLSFFVLFVQDVFACLCFGCITLAVLYYGNEGNLRVAALVAQVIGFVAYKTTLGVVLLKVIKRVRSFAVRIWEKKLRNQ